MGASTSTTQDLGRWEPGAGIRRHRRARALAPSGRSYRQRAQWTDRLLSQAGATLSSAGCALERGSSVRKCYGGQQRSVPPPGKRNPPRRLARVTLERSLLPPVSGGGSALMILGGESNNPATALQHILSAAGRVETSR